MDRWTPDLPLYILFHIYKMGIPVEGGKTRDPRQKRSDGVDDHTQPGGFHAVYLLPFRADF